MASWFKAVIHLGGSEWLTPAGPVTCLLCKLRGGARGGGTERGGARGGGTERGGARGEGQEVGALRGERQEVGALRGEG